MKKIILLLGILTLTSCSLGQFSAATYDGYPQTWIGTYDYDVINRMYLNNPTIVYRNYYNHPYFIRYRRESIGRRSYSKPAAYPRATPRSKPISTTPKVTQYRQNSGRSNKVNPTSVRSSTRSTSNISRNRVNRINNQ